MGAVTIDLRPHCRVRRGYLIAASEERPSGRVGGIALLSRIRRIPGKFCGCRESRPASRCIRAPPDAHREGGAASCGDRTSAHAAAAVVVERPPVLRSGLGGLQLRRIRRTSPAEGAGDLDGRPHMPDGRPAQITGYRPLARHYTFPLDKPDRQLDHILMRGRLGHVTASSAPALPLSTIEPSSSSICTRPKQPPNDQRLTTTSAGNGWTRYPHLNGHRGRTAP